MLNKLRQMKKNYSSSNHDYYQDLFSKEFRADTQIRNWKKEVTIIYTLHMHKLIRIQKYFDRLLPN